MCLSAYEYALLGTHWQCQPKRMQRAEKERERECSGFIAITKLYMSFALSFVTKQLAPVLYATNGLSVLEEWIQSIYSSGTGGSRLTRHETSTLHKSIAVFRMEYI